MKDIMDLTTEDLFGQNPMFKIMYQYAHPSGSFRTQACWVQAKDEKEAELQAIERIKALGRYPWYKITSITKLK